MYCLMPQFKNGKPFFIHCAPQRTIEGLLSIIAFRHPWPCPKALLGSTVVCIVNTKALKQC